MYEVFDTVTGRTVAGPYRDFERADLRADAMCRTAITARRYSVRPVPVVPCSPLAVGPL